MGKRGQPPTTHFIKRSIAFKVVQYLKRAQKLGHKLTVRQAWLKLSELDKTKTKFKKKGFQELINLHYANRTERYREFAVHNLMYRENRIQFYKNHIKKFVDEYLDFKETQFKRRFHSGIASILQKKKKTK